MKCTAVALAALAIALASCKVSPTGREDAAASPTASGMPSGVVPVGATGDPMASLDDQAQAPSAADMADSATRPEMQLQVVLDRLGFTPGVVDGKMGLSTANAIRGFQEANGLTVTGKLDQASRDLLARWKAIPATRVVTIPADFAAGPFGPLPKDPAEQARLPQLGYTSLDEKLAERFHTTVAVLRALNPGGVPAGSAPGVSPGAPAPVETRDASVGASAASGDSSYFHAGQSIRVPNVGADTITAASVSDKSWLATLVSLGVGSDQPHVDRIVVSKSQGTLKAYAANKLVGMYTATMGSRHDPLPLGTWKIEGISHNPKFQFNPDLLWDVPDSKAKQMLPPGPNGPVGVVWIDLSKEHYGIHGTPEPETIGRAQSHGCVRLTNWDAARLAQMVSTGTQVIFKE